MSKIVIWMIDQEKMLHKLTNRFICVWGHIPNKDLQITKIHYTNMAMKRKESWKYIIWSCITSKPKWILLFLQSKPTA